MPNNHPAPDVETLISRRSAIGALGALCFGLMSGCKNPENQAALAVGPSLSLKCGLEGQTLAEWEKYTERLLLCDEAVDAKITAGGVVGLKQFAIEAVAPPIVFVQFTRQLAEYGGTTARDALLEILTSDCGDNNRFKDNFKNYNYRYNLAIDTGRGLTWLLLGPTLSPADKATLLTDLNNLIKDSKLSEPVRRGLEVAVKEFYYGYEKGDSIF